MILSHHLLGLTGPPPAGRAAPRVAGRRSVRGLEGPQHRWAPLFVVLLLRLRLGSVCPKEQVALIHNDPKAGPSEGDRPPPPSARDKPGQHSRSWRPRPGEPPSSPLLPPPLEATGAHTEPPTRARAAQGPAESAPPLGGQLQRGAFLRAPEEPLPTGGSLPPTSPLRLPQPDPQPHRPCPDLHPQRESGPASRASPRGVSVVSSG